MPGNTITYDLLESYRPKLMRRAMNFFHNNADAEDVVQETLLLAWKNISSFRGGSPLHSWLYRILHNKSCNMWKARPKVELAADLFGDAADDFIENRGHHDTPEAIHSMKQQQIMIYDAFNNLSSALKESLLLLIDGLSYEEIARITGVPMGTVRSRIHRAREKLGLLN